MKEESKKQRLKELESQLSRSSSSFDSTEDDEQVDAGELNGRTNGHLNGPTNGCADERVGSTKKQLTNGSLQNGDLPNQRELDLVKPRKSTKKYGRTRADRSSKEFFDALLSSKKVSFSLAVRLAIAAAMPESLLSRRRV